MVRDDAPIAPSLPAHVVAKLAAGERALLRSLPPFFLSRTHRVPRKAPCVTAAGTKPTGAPRPAGRRSNSSSRAETTRGMRVAEGFTLSLGGPRHDPANFLTKPNPIFLAHCQFSNSSRGTVCQDLASAPERLLPLSPTRNLGETDGRAHPTGRDEYARRAIH